jgi:hypothetical protein
MSAINYTSGAGWSSSPFCLYLRGLFLCAALLALSALPFALTCAEAAEAVAKFTAVEGKVDVLSGGALPAVSVKAGDNVFVKDVVRTKSGASAEINFVDGTILKVAQRSRIDISEYVSEDAKGKRIINLPRGKVEALVPPSLTKRIEASTTENRFEIHTPNAVAGVRGTDYIVFCESNYTWVIVKEGIVRVYNPLFPDAVIMVGPGQLSTVPPNQPPVKKDATEGEKRRMEPPAKSGDAGATSSGTQGESSGNVATDTTAMGATPTNTTAMDTTVIGAMPTNTPAMDTTIATPPPALLPQMPPAFEVGRTTLSGSVLAGPATQLDYISVTVKDVIFLAPSTGQAPTLWNTNDISGSYRFGSNIVNGVGSIPVSDGNGITGDFNIGQWGNNNWSGTMNGQGNLSGGSYNGPVNFQGGVDGTHTGGTSGSFSGTGSGTATR